jgi:hypothetical protein
VRSSSLRVDARCASAFSRPAGSKKAAQSRAEGEEPGDKVKHQQVT